ncbi:MAG: hypothetical protein AB7I79_12620 [Rhizobiaceae bacterium]
MIRFLIVLILVVALALLVMAVVRRLRGARVDWTGVTFAVGFVVLAFWLRHVTGIV